MSIYEKNMNDAFYCKSFAEKSWNDHEQYLIGYIKSEVLQNPKQYILGVDDGEYKKYLVDTFRLIPIKVIKDSEIVREPRIEKHEIQDHGRALRDVYIFPVEYDFSGTPILFKLRPSTWTVTSYKIKVLPSSGKVVVEVDVFQRDVEKFRARKEQVFRDAFTNIHGINAEVDSWNLKLDQLASRLFDERKRELMAENDFFSAINVAVNSQTDGLFTVPTVTPQVIAHPKKPEGKRFTCTATMAGEMYEDVLKILDQVGRAMERKPSLYRMKDEEGLRDQFLLFLETRYKSATGTGETFNKEGKSDILLKHEEGANLFVAECKFWSGPKDFNAAIHQLFDRYLTWRDSKAALLIFVTNKDFSSVVEKVSELASSHPYFEKKLENRSESSLAFHFHLPNDRGKTVHLAILLFAFP